jgi:CheY-like chemotaxis protein
MEKFKILVAHERPVVGRAIARVLAAQGLAATPVDHGDAVWRALETDGWDGLVLDVALPGPPVHQLVALSKTGVPLALRAVVLIASVFRRSSYKRRPQQLYGADAYVEGHQLGAELPSLLWRLLTADPSGLDGMVEAEALLAELQAPDDRNPAERAAALAGLLVADVLMYASEKLSDADGTAGSKSLRPADIAAVHDALAPELTQAREHLRGATDLGVVSGDPIAAALDDLLRAPADGRGGP